MFEHVLAEMKEFFIRVKLKEASDGDYNDPINDDVWQKFNEVIQEMEYIFQAKEFDSLKTLL